MNRAITRFSLSTALLFAAVAFPIRAQDTPSDGFPRITLTIKPDQVRAGQGFELIGHVSADDAEIVQVFLDCTDAEGPEHAWNHEGNGPFESRVKHVETVPGIKEYEIWAKIQKGEMSRFVGEFFQINVEEKKGDEDLAAFLSWLKATGYSDDIVRIHAYDGTKPVVRQKWNKYFAMRKENLEYRTLQTMPIVFVDVLAAESEATNQSLEGQPPKLEAYMTRIYGKTFKIDYLQQTIPYEDHFGKPTLQENSKGDQWLKFHPQKLLRYARETAGRITQERQLPPNAVMIHWAAKKWKHNDRELAIQDLTGSGPANSGMAFDLYGLGIYAHEWGHGLGLGHMFVDGPGAYSDRIWGLECIMNHSYVGYSNREVGRLLSPLLRYVLEPKDGFLDQKTFAATYSEAMAGTEQMRRRLAETRTKETVASTMTWNTPWSRGSGDSVISKGLRNRSYEIQQLELLPGVQPGSYTLRVETSGKAGIPRTLALRQNGRTVASTPVAYRTTISRSDPHAITLKNYLSLVIGKSGRGTCNLYGIGKLLNEKPLVVPAR